LRSLKSVNRTLLTGTPLQNDIRELWALFNFLMPELFRDIEGFSSLLELEDMKDTNKLLENEAENKIISTIHKVLAPFTLRREKKFVLKDLVPKKEITVYCPLSEMQKYIYRAILQKDYDKLRMGRPAEEESSEGRRCRNKKVEYNESVIFGEGESEMKTRKLLRKSTKSNTFCSNKNVPFDCPDCPYICRITMQNTVMMLKKAVNHPYLIWTPIDPNAKSRQMFVSEDLIKHSGKLLVLEALLPKLKKMGHKVQKCHRERANFTPTVQF
jgi:SNF2 family DNA or RNA helicase